MLEKMTSLIKGGSAGSAVVVILTGGYLWLQTMGEGADNNYTMLLALSFLLYYLGKKDATQPERIEIPRLAETQQQKRMLIQPTATTAASSYYGHHACNSTTPNITITVNGEKREDCSEAREKPDLESVEKESPELCFYRIYKDKADQYRWQLKTRALSQDGEVITEIIGTSHQGFKTPIQCLNEIYRVMECCNARIEEDIDGDGKPTVVVPQPPPVGGRNTPYVDRTNVLRQELLAQKLFRDINKLGD